MLRHSFLFMLHPVFPFFFKWPYDGSKGFKPCCPNFKSCTNKGWSCSCEETWDNGACIILRTQLKHMRSHTNVMFVSVHNHMQALKRGSDCYCPHICTRQPRCFSSISSCAINKEQVKLLADWKMWLRAPVCFNPSLFHIKVQTKVLTLARRWLLFILEQGNQGGTLPSCEKNRQTNKQQ